MNSRERLLLSLEHREPDSIPIDLGSTNVTGITKLAYESLLKYLNIDDEIKIIDPMQQLVRVKNEILEIFKVDTIKFTANPPSNWTLTITQDIDNYYFIDEWGIKWRMPKKTPRYFDFKKHPLANTPLNRVKKYKWPDPDNKGRFRGLRKKARKLSSQNNKAIIATHPNGPGIFELACWLVGMEEFMITMVTDTKKAYYILNGIAGVYKRVWENYLKEIGEFIDVCVISEDLGTQCGPMISLKLFKQMIEPFIKELITSIKSRTKAKIFLHSCGDVSIFIPSLINIGVDILNPIQVSASNMNDTAKLKAEYGKDLVFWGAGCDAQNILPFGNKQKIVTEVRKKINDLKKNGGFVFAPIHNIQDGIPPENIVTMFKTAISSGQY